MEFVLNIVVLTREDTSVMERYSLILCSVAPAPVEL